ncbi:hypothetical protein [Stenotrophomonas sp. 278]|uniref:hypothetical protein n=1 Tax=Stenotrophomonas sp. 278 TaxID=2479851 RepID=UPI000F65E19F|nr:hypothetical protein [Stenotrophomonas sp. 278]RRU02341.1 hypothetical protein EGJ34_20250 [Stenotrophomonas sp. 278]
MNRCKPLAGGALVATTLLLGFTAQADTSLDEVVNPSMLGKTLKYAEFKIGSPAMREFTDDLGIRRNFYEVNGCTVAVSVSNSNVVSVGMSLEPTKGCDLDVNGIAEGAKPGSKATILASKTTFKDYAWRGPLHFTDPQLPSCNACLEGGFNANIDGVGALGMVSVQLEGATYTPDSRYQDWRSLLRNNGIDGTDSDALPITSSTCPLRRFDHQAYQLLKNTKVIGISFSRTSEVLQPQCSGKTVWPLIHRGG